MGAPPNDILINPPRSDRRIIPGYVATVTGITYGMVVIYDTGTTNFRDVKLPAGAAAAGVAGVVSDQGDPNLSGQFAIGDEFGLCQDGWAEVLLDAGAQATKGVYAVSSATVGTVKPVAGDAAPYDFICQFGETILAGATPILVSARICLHRRQA